MSLALALVSASFLFAVPQAQANPAGGGVLFAWGDGRDGQLGNGASVNQNRPYGPIALTQEMIDAGANSWDDVVLSHGGDTTFAITPTGELFAWGQGWAGQLGNGINADQNRPYGPIALTQEMIDAGANTWNDVTLLHHYQSTFALTSTGELFAWGQGWAGQLGNGASVNQNRPYGPIALTQEMIDAGVSTWNDVTLSLSHIGSPSHIGNRRIFAITPTGELFAWGGGAWGLLGDVSVNPNRPYGPIPLTQEMIDAGANTWNDVTLSHMNFSTFAVTPTGELFAWGNGSLGELGNGIDAHQNSPYGPIPLTQEMMDAGANTWNDVTLFPRFASTLALTPTGELFAWGFGWAGQLGNEVSVNHVNQNRPYGPIALTQEMIDAGVSTWNDVTLFHHCYATFALTPTGELFAWGSGERGELGNGIDAHQGRPYGPIPLTQEMMDAGANTWNDVTLSIAMHGTVFAILSSPPINITKTLLTPEGTTIPTDMSFDFNFSPRQVRLSDDPVRYSVAIAQVPTITNQTLTLDMTTLTTDTGTTSVTGTLDLLAILEALTPLSSGGVYVWEVREVIGSSLTTSPSYVTYDTRGFQLRVHANRDGGLGAVEIFEIIEVENQPPTLGDKVEGMGFANTLRTDTRTQDNNALFISKTVVGDMADLTTSFSFTLNLTPHVLAPITFPVSAYIITEGVAAPTPVSITTTPFNFTLTNGQRLSIPTLPVGTTFSVTEQAQSQFAPSVIVTIGGSVAEEESAGTGQALSTQNHIIAQVSPNSAAFTNTHAWDVPTGLVITTAPWVALALSAALLLAVLSSSRNRKRIEDLPIMY